MTNDLISREAALEALRARGRALLKLGTSFEANIASVTALECVNIVKDAPAVDAAPVVHAEWDHWGGDEWQCTNCAEFIHTEGSWERPYQKYCPYCGAKMDEGDKANAQPD